MARNKPALTVVEPDPDVPPPPPGLDEVGAALWREILGTWHWDDPVPLRVVREACVALQTAEKYDRIIEQDGPVLRVGKALKAHPLVKEATAARALGCRLLARLGTDLEPIKPMGRPPGMSFV